MSKHLFLCLTLLLIFCVSCTEKEEVYMFVEGGPEFTYEYQPLHDSLRLADSRINLRINTDPKFDTLCVLVNGDTLSPYDINDYQAEFGNIIEPEFITYNLRIESDIGTASANCRVPEPFKIIKPCQPIQSGSDCEIIWHSSKNAQWYRVYLAIVYHPIISYKTIATRDTCVTIEGSLFAAPNGVVEMLITANDSDPDEDNGNIKGNGIGYWSGKLTVCETINIR